MISPVLGSWIKQRSFDTGFRINGSNEVSFEHIATGTRQTQIVQRSFPFERYWNNMVDFHLYYDGFLCLAVLALSLSSFMYLLSQELRNPCHPLCPKLEQPIDIVSALLQ